jgi:hypothetical protein
MKPNTEYRCRHTNGADYDEMCNSGHHYASAVGSFLPTAFGLCAITGASQAH